MIGLVLEALTLPHLRVLFASLCFDYILIGVWFQKYGKIDIVVCNAAANPSTDPILSTKEAVLDKLWEINVKSSILLLQVKLFLL